MDEIHQNYQLCYANENTCLLRNPADNLIYVWYIPYCKMMGTIPVPNDWKQFYAYVADDILYIKNSAVNPKNGSDCNTYYIDLKPETTISTKHRIVMTRELGGITLALTKNLFDKYVCVITFPPSSKIIDTMDILYDILTDVLNGGDTETIKTKLDDEKLVLTLTIDYKYVNEIHRFVFTPLLADRLDLLETKVNYLLAHKN